MVNLFGMLGTWSERDPSFRLSDRVLVGLYSVSSNVYKNGGLAASVSQIADTARSAATLRPTAAAVLMTLRNTLAVPSPSVTFGRWQIGNLLDHRAPEQSAFRVLYLHAVQVRTTPLSCRFNESKC